MPRSLRVLIGALTGVVLAGLLALTGLRFVEIDSRVPLALTSFSAYALPGYAVVLVVCVLLSIGAELRWVPLLGAAVSLVLLVVNGTWASHYLGGTGVTDTDLTVVSSNLQYGMGDPAGVTRSARGADVLVLQEVTPAALVAIEATGLTDRLRFRAGRPVEGVSGTMVLSRYRLTDVEPLAIGNGGFTVRVGGPTPFRLYAVHTAMLLGAPHRWHDDLSLLRKRLAADVANGPVLAVGDWNATYSHLPMRRVLDSGMTDAAQQAGSWDPTWPTRWRRSWLRPMVAIDHVLQSDDFVSVATSTSEVSHTDHMALRATLAFREPAASATE